MEIRGLVAILCGVLAACSGAEAPGAARQEAAPSARIATATSDAASAAEAALSEPTPLPPALAEVLRADRSGLAQDPRDALAIAFEEYPGDHLPIVLGGASVVDEDSLPAAALGPVPAAPEEGLH